MFPSVIPLSGTDCSRVTHPSAARIQSSNRSLPIISPLDLHVLSTPPAFVLSQDQTLMFNPYLELESSEPPTRQSRSFLEPVQAFHSFESDRFLYVFVSLYRFQGSCAAIATTFRIVSHLPHLVNPFFHVFQVVNTNPIFPSDLVLFLHI